jgi:hypothetical protein
VNTWAGACSRLLRGDQEITPRLRKWEKSNHA